MRVTRPKKIISNNPSPPRVPKTAYVKRAGTQFPRPKKMNFPVEESQKFFDYWASIPKEHVELVDIRVNRNWPVINRSLTGNKTGDIARYHGAIPPDWQKGFADHILFQFGSGDYKFYLYEVGVQGLICSGIVRVRDMEAHPPRLDVRELVIGDPDNKSYLEGLRIKGIKLPGDAGYSDPKDEEVKDDMAQQAYGQMTDTIIKLATTVGEQAKNKQNPEDDEDRKLAARTVADVGSFAAKEAITMIKESARDSMETMKTMVEAQNKANATSKDPIEMFSAITDIVSKLKGGGEDSALVKILLEASARSTARNEELLLGQIKFLQSIQQAPPPPPPPPPKSTLEVFDEMLVMQEKFKSMFGGGTTRRRGVNNDDDEEEEDKTPPAPPSTDLTMKFMENAPLLIGGITTLFALGANIAHNIAVARSGNGQPATPPSMQVPGAGMPPPQYAQHQVQPPPGYAQQPQGPPAQVAPPPPSGLDQQTAAVLEQIREPLLNHFLDEDSGGDGFAHWLVTGGTGTSRETVEGRQFYEGMKGLGPIVVKSYLNMYPPIWNVIGGHGMRVDEFIDDFMNYDQLMKEAEEEEPEPEPVVPPQPIKKKKKPEQPAVPPVN